MATTYEPIATTSPGNVAQVTFSSISSAYTDLVLILSINPSGEDQIGIRFNSDSSTSYSLTRLSGINNAAQSSRTSSSTFPIVMVDTYVAGTPALFKFDIFSYSGNTYKTFLSSTSNDKNATGSEITSCVGLWRDTSAINRIDLYGSFSYGSTVTLYGILKA